MVVLGLFILFVVIGLVSPQGQQSLKEGQKAGKSAASQDSSSPTAIPKPSLQAEPQKYIDYSKSLASFFDDTNKFNTELVDLLGKYPNLTDDDRINLAKDTIIMEKAYDRILAIKPPPELLKTHQKYLSGYQLIKGSMPILRNALDNNNQDLLNQATAKIAEASKLISQANDEVSTFTNSLKQ